MTFGTRCAPLAPWPGGTTVDKCRVQPSSSLGLLWVAGWLFTIGFLHLTFWKGVLAVVLWPYYLGVALSSLGH